MSAKQKLRIFTDGACSGNPGPGGWGAVICLTNNVEKISGYESTTTNNRMELTAVTSGIKNVLEKIYESVLEIDELEIISDSAYVVNAINRNWLEFWKAANFVNKKGEEIKNIDLWKVLDEQLETLDFLGIRILFSKVKGHSGNAFNELADCLARNEIKNRHYFRNGGIME